MIPIFGQNWLVCQVGLLGRKGKAANVQIIVLSITQIGIRWRKRGSLEWQLLSPFLWSRTIDVFSWLTSEFCTVCVAHSQIHLKLGHYAQYQHQIGLHVTDMSNLDFDVNLHQLPKNPTLAYFLNLPNGVIQSVKCGTSLTSHDGILAFDVFSRVGGFENTLTPTTTIFLHFRCKKGRI